MIDFTDTNKLLDEIKYELMKDDKKPKIVEYKIPNSRHGHHGEKTARFLVPGVNSGVYDPALHISIRQTNAGTVKTNWTIGRVRRLKQMYIDVTIPIEKVRELRDECNKILAMDFGEIKHPK